MDMEWWEWLVVMFIVCVIAFAAFGAYCSYNRPTYILNKDEWICIKEEYYTFWHPIVASKAVINVPMKRLECTEYKRV